MATASGDLRAEAVALNGLGWVAANQAQTEKARDYQNRALPIAIKIGEKDVEATVLRRLGTLDEPTDKQKALNEYNRALMLYSESGDLNGEARTLNSIGLIDDTQGDKQIGQGSGGLLVEPDGARAFVSCGPDNYVVVIDLRTMAVIGHIEAGGEADGLAWAFRR